MKYPTMGVRHFFLVSLPAERSKTTLTGEGRGLPGAVDDLEPALPKPPEVRRALPEDPDRRQGQGQGPASSRSRGDALGLMGSF